MCVREVNIVRTLLLMVAFAPNSKLDPELLHAAVVSSSNTLSGILAMESLLQVDQILHLFVSLQCPAEVCDCSTLFLVFLVIVQIQNATEPRMKRARLCLAQDPNEGTIEGLLQRLYLSIGEYEVVQPVIEAPKIFS